MAEQRANPFDEILAELAGEAEAFGRDVVEAKRHDLSVPVEYVGGGRVIRSKPGEFPRRETGNLQGSIRHIVRAGDHRLSVTITTPVGYAEPLQDELRRVVFNDLADRFGDNFAERLAARI